VPSSLYANAYHLTHFSPTIVFEVALPAKVILDASDKGKKIETFESQPIGKPATSSSRDKIFSELVKDATSSDGQGNECVVKAQSKG
jgi:hypothetical protein